MAIITSSLEMLQLFDVVHEAGMLASAGPIHTMMEIGLVVKTLLKEGHMLSVPHEAPGRVFNRKIASAFDAKSAQLLCQIVQFVG